ncbi:MAG: SRPBCC family protein [Pseudomonadota bacterium]
MDRDTELELIDEILALKAKKSAFLKEGVARNSVEHYTSQSRFDLERDRIFRSAPAAAAHASELSEPGSFLRRELGGLPILLTRDKSGGVNAFVNACRHRGTRLVEDEAGCKHRFSCPYHAWTYSSAGDLLAAPHLEEGFPDLDKAELGLTRLDCQEKFGFIWVTPSLNAHTDLDAHFGDLSDDLAALGIEDMFVAQEDIQIREANWKILVEGGIEAYHFKVAHRTTIGPHFEDNLSSYRAFDPHLRSILPRTSLAKLTESSRETWRLRDHAQVLYSLFPTTQLLVQQDHLAWIEATPLSPSRTRMRLVTLAPKALAEDKAHWAQNHKITTTTLDEDFVIGESIQSTLDTGANQDMLFGRFEGALDEFNRVVDSYLEPDPGVLTAA